MLFRSDEQASLVLLPVEEDGRLSLKLTWMVVSRSDSPKGRFRSFVDANNGELLAWYNEYRFFSGTMTGTIDNRYVGNGSKSANMRELAITGSDRKTVYTDASGKYTLPEGTATAKLAGSYVTVLNQGGSEGSLSFSSGNANWTKIGRAHV